jgi:Mg-chelatase subunit ChlI
VSVEEEAVARRVRRLEALGLPYMVAGSVASSHHGLPRATNDADIVVDPTPEALEALVAGLAEEGYYVDVGVARDALRGRRLFNVIDPESAFKVDLIVRKERPFSREEFARRERRDLGRGLTASIATPEDTILSKLEWARKGGGSERQLDDALGVLRVGGDRIDRSYVAKWAAVLGIDDLWRGLLARLSG